EALLELIDAEYRARKAAGDECDLVAYRDRFPDEFADLQRQVTTPSSVAGPPSHLTQVASRPADLIARPPSMPGAGPDGMLPIGGGYQLLERIGSGGFGEVWKAEAPGGVECAIKIIFRPLDHADAQAELEALELIKRLHHPFLLQTHAFFSLEDRLVIAME